LESEFKGEIKEYIIIAENGFKNLDENCLLWDYLKINPFSDKSLGKIKENRIDNIANKILLKKGIRYQYMIPPLVFDF